MELNQQVVKKELLSILETKRESILLIQQRTTDSNDVKSSAGDKHETGVAMAHLEQEKIGKQLQLVESMLSTVNKLTPISSLDKINILRAMNFTSSPPSIIRASQ